MYMFPYHSLKSFHPLLPLCPKVCSLCLWYIYTVEYYSALKKKAFESVLMRWMNVEPITQSQVSQKEKKYCILTHIYGIREYSTDDRTCRAAKEIQT